MEKSTKSNKTPYSHCNVTVTGNIWLQVKVGGYTQLQALEATGILGAAAGNGTALCLPPA